MVIFRLLPAKSTINAIIADLKKNVNMNHYQSILVYPLELETNSEEDVFQWQFRSNY